MSPEQLEHCRATVQSDIYSLGLILYEMVTGTKPFSDESAWKRICDDPRPPKTLVAELPDTWNKTIVCCLEKETAYRFPNVNAVAGSLSGQLSVSAIPKKPILVRLKTTARLRARYIAMVGLLVVALSIPVLRYFRQSPEVPSGTTVLVTDIVTADASLAE